MLKWKTQALYCKIDHPLSIMVMKLTSLAGALPSLRIFSCSTLPLCERRRKEIHAVMLISEKSFQWNVNRSHLPSAINILLLCWVYILKSQPSFQWALLLNCSLWMITLIHQTEKRKNSTAKNWMWLDLVWVRKGQLSFLTASLLLMWSTFGWPLPDDIDALFLEKAL